MLAGHNKGELKNTLSHAFCFNTLGELRDHAFDGALSGEWLKLGRPCHYSLEHELP